ncbi:hypothetical protein BD413DRAFT_602246 [Trametes elegans]|nr:hypothetical protein BD413DRAFT_602246 [Trametes elegans]
MFSRGIAVLLTSWLGQSLVLTANASPAQIFARDDTPTNLPPPTYNGSFTGHASVVIDAPIDKVWDVLLDFPKYSEWYNKKPLANQTAVEGAYLVMQVHIPPSTNDAIPTIPVFELISAVQPNLHRVAWVSTLPEWFVHAERWQALSTTADNRTLYESREVFAGAGAWAIKAFIGDPLEDSFVAQAEGLKNYTETH